MNKSKKIISIFAAAALALSTMSLAACGTQEYKGEVKGDDYVSSATVSSNGGFVVEKGDYVYFINGKEENTADNTYGDAVKGSLMRISKADLAAGVDLEQKAKIVVPSLFVTGNYDSGIYIYGDYVYYATPTTDRNNAGQVANTSLDFKRAKIDGSEAPMGGKDEYFFRVSSNSIKYRYVQVNDVVYCLYEEDSALKSYNTSTKKTTVLVKGASAIYYDTEDLTNPNVYYAMGVTLGLDEENSTSQPYNQIYTVNAAATVSVDASKAAYTAKDENGKVVASYDFNEDFFKQKNEEAKEEDKDAEAPYDLSDHTTYPYVNLGKLVLDGIGSTHAYPAYRKHALGETTSAGEPFGYTYAVQGYKNGGVYFTRKPTNASLTYLYYLSDGADDADTWNTISGNATATEISKDVEKASATAFYLFDGTTHSYFYTATEGIYYVKGDKEVVIPFTETANLWKVDGDYLYFYGSGTNGNGVSRVNYKGEQTDYNWNFEEKYDVVTLPLVDFNDSWYKPEFVTVGEKTMLLYANAQSFGAGSTSYNNIYVATVGTNEEIKAANEKIEEINEEIADNSADVQNLMKYYFRTADTAAYEDVKDLYSKEQQKLFNEFVEKFKQGGAFEGQNEGKFIQALGRVNEAESEAIADAWTSYLKTREVEEENDELPTWAIVLIVCGSVLVVGGAATAIALVALHKKKVAKEQKEAIVNAYKRKKIDTTDDKTIDVYADEDVEPSVEPVAEVEETPVEEAPVEEAAEVENPAEEN